MFPDAVKGAHEGKKTSDGHQSTGGAGSRVAIIIGVIAALVLIALLIAIVVSVIKKRKSAKITESTPLGTSTQQKEDQQQQRH